MQGLDKKLLKLNRQIQEDERISSNPVVKIVYGDPVTFLSQLPRDSHIHHSKMWSCRKRISVENLAHVVQQKNARDAVPLLWRFLQKVGEGLRCPGRLRNLPGGASAVQAPSPARQGHQGPIRSAVIQCLYSHNLL